MKLKRIICLLLCLLLMFSIVACGKGQSNQENDKTTTPTPTQPPKEENDSFEILEGKQDEYKTLFDNGQLRCGNTTNIEAGEYNIQIVAPSDKTMYIEITASDEQVKLYAENEKDIYIFEKSTKEKHEKWKKYTQESEENSSKVNVTSSFDFSEVVNKDKIVSIEYKHTIENKDVVIVKYQSPYVAPSDEENPSTTTYYTLDFVYNGEECTMNYIVIEYEQGGNASSTSIKNAPDDFKSFDYDIDFDKKVLIHKDTGETIPFTVNEIPLDDIEKEFTFDAETKKVLSIVDYTNKEIPITYTFSHNDTAKGMCQVPSDVEEATKNDFIEAVVYFVFTLANIVSGQI